MNGTKHAIWHLRADKALAQGLCAFSGLEQGDQACCRCYVLTRKQSRAWPAGRAFLAG